MNAEGLTIFPLRDDAPSNLFPALTFSILILNLAIFAVFNLTVYEGEGGLERFFLTWATVPREITANGDYIRLVTSMFMHAGLVHLAGNMLFLLIFADNVESALGHLGFALFYLVCGIASWAAQILSVPDSEIPGIGASGAIAGVMGGFLVMFPHARILVFIPFVFFLGRIWLPAWIVLSVWFGSQLLWAVLSFGVDEGGTAFAAHAGGFAAGLLLALPARWKRGHPDTWEDTTIERIERPKVDLRAMRKQRQATTVMERDDRPGG